MLRRRIAVAFATTLAVAIGAGGVVVPPGAAVTLPDHRGYEVVSPADKNGANVLLTTERVRLAPDGDAIGWAALAGFSDTQGVGVAADYMSVRTSGGWVTHALTPRQRSLAGGDLISVQEPLYVGPYAADLNRGVFFGVSPLTDSPNVASVPNLYRRTDLRTPGPGKFDLITACPLCDATSTPLPPVTGDGLSINRARPTFVRVSRDFERILFESRARLTSDVPPQPATCDPTTVGSFFGSSGSSGCRLHLYEWDHGTVRLAGVLPDGSAADVSIGASGASNGRLTLGALSDGSDGHDRVFFTQPTNTAGQTSSDIVDPTFQFIIQTGINLSSVGNLYMRVDHAVTEQLNLSERGTLDTFAPAKFLDASADGTHAFFMTTQALTEDAPADGFMKVYMYDATKPGTDPHNLTLVDRDDEPSDGSGNALGAIGVSADGAYFYFVNETQLVRGGPEGPTWIYLWHNGQLRPVGPADQAGVGVRELLAAEGDWSITPLQGRVTPDGRHLLFSATMGRHLTGYDHGACGFGLNGGCRELYVYNADTDTVACASCNPSGAPATGNATIFTGDNTVGGTRTDPPNTQPITSDGSRVFFTSPEALVPEDTNNRLDAYEYDVRTGIVSLLSSGKGTSDSYFVDTTSSGSDAFFITRDRLVAQDVDDSYDLYDARVNGGFPAPPPPPLPCTGSTCRPSQSPVGAYVPQGSATFRGGGNVPRTHPAARRARCRRGRVLKHIRGRRRCVKPRTKRARAQANGNTRRGS